MKKTPRALKRDVHLMASQILAVYQQIDQALGALDECQPGYPTSSGGAFGNMQLGDDGTPSGLECYVLRRDEALLDQAMLRNLIAETQGHVTALHQIVVKWSSPPATISNIEQDSSCVTCERHCSGKGEDRLRAGLCPACRMQWQRWRKEHNGTRHEWMTARRRAAWDAEQAAAHAQQAG